jgi:hypothetical protein
MCTLTYIYIYIEKIIMVREPTVLENFVFICALPCSGHTYEGGVRVALKAQMTVGSLS